MEKLVLTWGNPTFLGEFWDKNRVEPYEFETTRDYIFGGTEQLKARLLELHVRVDNAETLGRTIVVGNGAKQILYAALYAMKKVRGLHQVIASTPYFSRFPKIVELSGLHWNDRYKSHDDTIQIITSPNNPDGHLQHTFRPNTIHDLVYNWTQYTELNPVREDEEIMIFSLSKALGLASTRIGWALVKDQEIAKAMAEYVELTTSGVSIEAQESAFNHINNALQCYPSPFLFGKLELAKRWKAVYNLRDVVPFEICSSNGMFLWGKLMDHEKFFEDKGIEVISGTDFGAEKDYFRINLGCSTKDFNEFLRRIK